jgi:anti-sigma factor RsiW
MDITRREDRGANRGAVADLILEQYRLGELPIADAERVERLVTSDGALRRRLEALDESDAEIARVYPAARLAQAVRARLPVAAARDDGWRVALAFAAAVVVILLLPRAWIDSALRTVTDPQSQAPPDDDRIKGLKPSLAIYRRTATGSETLADGSVARAGDLLRVGYAGAGRGYGVIVSIDGRGAVTLHLPPAGERAAALVSGGITLLDQAYELDEAPGWERFYFVTSDTPFDVAPIMAAARKAASGTDGFRPPPATLAIAPELSQSAFSIQKEVKK